MKLLKSHRAFVIKEIIKYLFVALFCYAAFSKILDYEQFRVQLGQSPMLSAFADYVAIGVPTIELLTIIFLVVPKMELIGLYGFYILMVMFTTYIIIILNYADFVPCSCGGVLETLGWLEHLIFNIIFMTLGIIGIWVSELQNHSQYQ